MNAKHKAQGLICDRRSGGKRRRLVDATHQGELARQFTAFIRPVLGIYGPAVLYGGGGGDPRALTKKGEERTAA